ncbi:leucyl/phenylalanyl-tRNA--protein transferase [Undibacterium fentianense]|uniref:Leucyl/phenylalanyl-tRNA--protein transferase n=1 Tax=Undibacterium fentianense TaxID=2828728 RepID=A0A941E0V7_9BURK|nr:leucyl/phenylalanyl-tRNA--protein transferase [Undibacterium fentianense]MBR7799207.1 leucyl/phenylalanyl-tRNA--protein transferase [Undibacterium fentianense]
MIPWLENHSPFPPVEQALSAEQGAAGLLAAGADLSPYRLLNAYQHGIFPWFSEGQPILWWSTDPRMILKTNALKISNSLKKTLKRSLGDRRWAFRFNTAFEQVMRNCSAPRRGQDGTWISEDIITGYTKLHYMGYAHSSEIWLDNQLVGGGYGICIGKMFYGESMFAKVSDASKMALVQLVVFLRQQGVEMIDCQQETSHLASFGARPVRRADFVKHMNKAILEDPIQEWIPLNSQNFQEYLVDKQLHKSDELKSNAEPD